ncbi:MAG: DNA alkylation repair protein [Pseudonocardiales bacterium]|nr:MAG: DNA alkylation repair protein [Pseudonocardiales bacterium]
MCADDRLIAEIRQALHSAADPEQAPGMQAYMKSAMPYLGVRVPQVRAIVRAAARERPPSAIGALRATTLMLWHGAAHREERYAATALTDVVAARRLRAPELITLYEELIVSGAWWDHVDELSRRVGELLLAFPVEIRPIVSAWQRSTDHWLRRASIICQLGASEHTDIELLTAAILASAPEGDFFLRKGIGWALRDYARTDPQWVRAFVEEHAGQLSPLSRREALKRIN